MITLGTYKSFRTVRAAKREIMPLLALLALQNDQFTIIAITNCWEKINIIKAKLILEQTFSRCIETNKTSWAPSIVSKSFHFLWGIKRLSIIW